MRLSNTPRKKRRMVYDQVSLECPPKKGDPGIPPPIPLATLQNCGISCGVDHVDLTLDALCLNPDANVNPRLVDDDGH